MNQVSTEQAPVTLGIGPVTRQSGNALRRIAADIRRALNWLRAVMWSIYDDAGNLDDLRRL